MVTKEIFQFLSIGLDLSFYRERHIERFYRNDTLLHRQENSDHFLAAALGARLSTKSLAALKRFPIIFELGYYRGSTLYLYSNLFYSNSFFTTPPQKSNRIEFQISHRRFLPKASLYYHTRFYYIGPYENAQVQRPFIRRTIHSVGFKYAIGFGKKKTRTLSEFIRDVKENPPQL
jgi:hypothetical protein